MLDIATLRTSISEIGVALNGALAEAADRVGDDLPLRRSSPELCKLLDLCHRLEREAGLLYPPEEEEPITEGFRKFILLRISDVTGVSGTGVVAEGVQFTDGHIAMRWLGEMASVILHDSIENVMKIHGHGGATHVVWFDDWPIEKKGFDL